MKFLVFTALFVFSGFTASIATPTTCPNGQRDYRAVSDDLYHVYECQNNAWVFIFEQDRNTGPQDD